MRWRAACCDAVLRGLLHRMSSADWNPCTFGHVCLSE